MSSSGTPTMQPVSTQTQEKEPWSGAAPYLTSMYGTAEAMRNAGVGYQPYAGETVAGSNPWMDTGLGALAGMSQSEISGTGPVQAARGLGSSMIGSQGISGNQSDVLSYLGPMQRMMAEGGGGPADVYRKTITDADTADNPYLQQIMDTMNRRIGDRVNSSFSGAGRYGSGQHMDVLGRSMAEAEAPIMAQDYEARQARKLQGAQGLGQAAGQRASVLGGLNEAYGGGLNRAGQWAQMAPQLDAAQYAGAERMAGLGQFGRQMDQEKINAALKFYNAQQSYPWEQLFRESAVVGGGGGLGGTTVTGASQAQASPLQRILGGGIAGAGIGSAFGPIGTGIGALGGGALGGFL
jgi:hypothetical protein